MTKLNTTRLNELPIKTILDDDDYVVISGRGTKKIKAKDITKDIEKKAADLEEKTTELGSQLDTKANLNNYNDTITLLRKEKLKKSNIIYNNSLFSKETNETRINILTGNRISDSGLSFNGIVTNNSITVDGIILDEIQAKNHYSLLQSSPSKTPEGKKYLCSFYYIKPDYNYKNDGLIYLYHSADSSTNKKKEIQHFVDNQLRRAWFYSNGGAIPFITGFNPSELSIFVGGFQIEEVDLIPNDGIIFIGDSTMAGSSGWKEGDDSSGDISANKEWAKTICSILNVTCLNRAIGGHTTTDMVNRWATDITPYKNKVKYCIILGGINDLSLCNVDVILNNHALMHEKAINDGLIPIHCNITPCKAHEVNYDAEQTRKEANKRLKEIYGNNLIDIDSVVCDVKNNSYILDSWVEDGVHYLEPAKNAIAEYILNTVKFDFETPSSLQIIKDNEFNKLLEANLGFEIKDDNKVMKSKIQAYGNNGGVQYELIGESNKSYRIRNVYNVLYEDFDGKEIQRTGDIKEKNNRKVEYTNVLGIPLLAPTSLGTGQIFVEDGKLYITIGGIKKEIAFVN